jgi:phage virion morphogenesis protein
MEMPKGMPNATFDPGLSISFRPTLLSMNKDLFLLAHDFESFREPLKRAIREVLAPSFRKNFDVGGRPTWRPLEQSTVETRARYNKGKKILVESGALQRAAGQQNIWEVQANSANITGLPAKVSYGIVHQLGYQDRSGVSVPARPFLVIQAEDAQHIEDVFVRWIRERAVLHGWKPGVL